MARRTYTPSSRPNKGANIRIGNCDVVDHIDFPIGAGNLRKGSVDACGAIAGRKGSFNSISESARASMYGRDVIEAVASTEPTEFLVSNQFGDPVVDPGDNLDVIPPEEM